MATSDNERYLRYILLLGKGGPLVLKGILKREAQNVGKPLSQILSNNNGKLRHLIRNESQYERIFPSAGSVNDDLDNWDTSLLCLVILNIFRSSLTSEERDDIKILRDFRNEIQGHSASLALSEDEYNEYRSDLIIVLLKFSSKIDRQYHVECQELIKSTKSGPIEISSTLDDFKEFQTELLTVIKADFGANSIKLDDICKEIKKMQGTTVQQKELAEENLRRLCKMENEQDEIRQKVEVTNVQQKELVEENRSHFCKMEMGQDEIRQMLKELLKRKAEASTNGNTDIQEDVETELHVQSKNDQTASSAEDMLVQKINELLRVINSAPEPKTINEEHVRKRVQRYLQTKEHYSNDKELTIAVMELMIDVLKQSGTTILPAEKCCIRFVVRCKSYTGLLGLLEYLESKAFNQRIQDITTALRKQTEISVFLTVVVSAHSLQRIKKNLMQTQITTGSCEPRNRTVTLPVHSRNIRSIEHVWKLFQEGDINHHLLNISRILSTIVGGNIEITSSINLTKLKQSLQNIESKDTHTRHDESKTVTSEEKIDEVSTCRLKDATLFSSALSDVLDDIGVNEENVMKRRKAAVLYESIRNNSGKTYEMIYFLGSQSEGTTTSGLDSGLDVYTLRDCICLNPSCDQTKHEASHAMLVQKENMPPGHYLLQQGMLNICANYVHTPPCNINVCIPCYETRVKIGCNTFLKPEMNKYVHDKEYFLVPSPMALTENVNFEWKIYHAFAERYLMFNLNIVQIRCLVVMKIIIKSYLHSLFRVQSSSVVCKAVLLYCIENSNLEIWHEYNFWLCLSNCLKVLYQFVLCGSCPHFLECGDNLISRQLSQKEKEFIVKKLQTIIQDGWHFLFGIEIDGIGQRLKEKCLLPFVSYPSVYSLYIDSERERILKISTMSNPKPTEDDTVFLQKFLAFLPKFFRFLNDFLDSQQASSRQICDSPHVPARA